MHNIEKIIKHTFKTYNVYNIIFLRVSDKKTDRQYYEYYEWTDRYYEWTDEYYEWEKSTTSDQASNTIT